MGALALCSSPLCDLSPAAQVPLSQDSDRSVRFEILEVGAG